MRRPSRRRPTGPRRATFAAVALILGGGGLMVGNVYASATEPDRNQGVDQNQGVGRSQGAGKDGGRAQGGEQNGPAAADYADITGVRPEGNGPREEADASRGSFTSSCGVNANGLFNSDNVIVAPGVGNGAHHFHDYVGNQANNAFASDETLANGDTSCADKGDRSTYYWPVLRLRDGTRERDADAPGGGTEGNTGRIVTPEQVTLTFGGNPRGKVTAMPRFLRIITGDAKAFVNGPANANASWSCTGFEDRRLKDKYPLCPAGSKVVRTFRFQSCWDGRNIDSANHRTHVAFAGADGSCPDGFRAIPRLVQRIVYDVAAPSLADGGRTSPLFAVDSFPEQLHKPVTDHGDFINVFDDRLMREMVDCINSGRQCGSGRDQKPSHTPVPPRETRPPAEPEAATSPTATKSPAEPAPATAKPSRTASASPSPARTAPARTPSASPASPRATSATSAPPRTVSATPAPARTASAGASQDVGGSRDSGGSGGDVGDPTQAPSPSGNGASGGTGPGPNGSTGSAQTEPQAVQGDLAETGTRLWPAAAGAALVIAGFLLLHRIRRAAR
ncbi:DUF1996 domain-containing protein [Streptomyces sp. MK5]|uniref:DUF1996 domain-containing protein n=1 Tax=Streptomyces sp. MK5 TaxID=3064253 RepID=UPI002741057E|nr:DUF1996 domain-containing protein [Streptomyces sp. MK5]